ncbi:MAG: hypothetical protein ACO3UU_04135 [Minisyncoccia bacterium]
MSTIPKEYLESSFDFGFSAVDDPDKTPVPSAPTVSTEEISGPILERIKKLETNIEEVVNILERIEQASTPNLDTEEYKALISKDINEKLKLLESMIMPLLVNLMKNPEKDYIHWPNRSALIQKQIDKIISITRS